MIEDVLSHARLREPPRADLCVEIEVGMIDYLDVTSATRNYSNSQFLTVICRGAKDGFNTRLQRIFEPCVGCW